MTFSPRAPARVLPPPPRRRDWGFAGAAAGAFLAASELALAGAAGHSPTPRLSAALALAAMALVVAPAWSAGFALRILGRRPSHAALCGSLLGMLLAAPALGAALGALVAGGPPAWSSLLALVLAALAGLAAARLAHRLEEGGVVLPGATLLLAAALCVGAGEWMDEVARVSGPHAIAASLAVAALLAGIGTFLVRRARHQRSLSPAPWPRALLVATLAAVLASLGPRAIPWILVDVTLPPLGEAPPALLAVDLGRLRADDPLPLGMELLAHEGVSFAVEDAPSWPGALAALGLGAVVDALAARGYATSVLLRDPARAAGWPEARVDTSPGPGAWLERFGARTAGGPLLASLGGDRLRAIGLGARVRSPRDVAAEASAWLVAWRSDRSHAPFALFVDLADDRARTPEDAVDAASADLRDLLQQLEMAPRTLVVAVVARVAAGGERVLEIAIGLPATERARISEVAAPVRSEARPLATALAALPDVAPGAPVPLPGVEWISGDVP